MKNCATFSRLVARRLIGCWSLIKLRQCISIASDSSQREMFGKVDAYFRAYNECQTRSGGATIPTYEEIDWRKISGVRYKLPLRRSRRSLKRRTNLIANSRIKILPSLYRQNTKILNVFVKILSVVKILDCRFLKRKFLLCNNLARGDLSCLSLLQRECIKSSATIFIVSESWSICLKSGWLRKPSLAHHT